MPVSSNIKKLYGVLESVSIEIKDEVHDKAMTKIGVIAKVILAQEAAGLGVNRSDVTGQGRKRSRKQQRQNLSYGGSILNFRKVKYETPDVTGVLAGSPRKLGYRLWFIEGGTKQLSLWNKSTRQGLLPRPFVGRAKKKVQQVGLRIIQKSIKDAIKKYKVRK
jgi:hypothetical protein